MKRQMSVLYKKNGMSEAWDDTNNVFLEPDKVAAARAEEMSFFKNLGVYRRVLRAMIKQVGGNIVSVKWFDTNKGDRDFPNFRSRLVAREYNGSKDDILYASTPPLEALRMIMSYASIIDPAKPQDRRNHG